MADQMREARRRRILENSEKRLQRILGASTNEEGKFSNIEFLFPRANFQIIFRILCFLQLS